MNIIEANNTGLPFKRKGWDKFYRLTPAGKLKGILFADLKELDKKDLLADDYETPAERRLVTFAEFHTSMQDARIIDTSTGVAILAHEYYAQFPKEPIHVLDQ